MWKNPDFFPFCTLNLWFVCLFLCPNSVTLHLFLCLLVGLLCHSAALQGHFMSHFIHSVSHLSCFFLYHFDNSVSSFDYPTSAVVILWWVTLHFFGGLCIIWAFSFQFCISVVGFHFGCFAEHFRCYSCIIFFFFIYIFFDILRTFSEFCHFAWLHC